MVDVDCTHSMWDCSIMRADTNSPNEEASKDAFPAGLRVLVVDDDHSTLLILKRMLIACRYNVRVCGRATEALALLRENKNSFDLVISDVYMPDMDGFKLLEQVGLEMDLPVIMMSVDGDYNNVYKGITHGACDYLQKPVRIEELRNIWQHVYRKKAKELDNGTPGNTEQKKATEEHEHTSSTSSRKRKQDKDEEEAGEHDSEDPSSLKKPRVVWTVELHQQFVNAVNQLNIEKAVPKRILELMDVPGLTRENVASHLQKYRLYLKRIQRQQQENAMNIPVGNPTGNHGPVLTHPPGGVPSQQSGLLPLAGYLPSFGGGYQMEPPQQPLPLTPRGLTGGFTGTFVNNNIVSPRQAYQQTILEDIPFGAPSSLTASSVPSNLTVPSNFNNFSTGNLTTSSNFNLAPSNLPAPLTANAVSLVAPLYNEEICCTSAPKALNSVGYGGLTGFNHNQVLSPPASFNRSINFKKVDDQRSTADSSFKPRVSDPVNESAVTAKLGLQIDQPPADDLLNYLLKQQQQQEGVGFDDLVFDGYAPNNLFVK